GGPFLQHVNWASSASLPVMFMLLGAALTSLVPLGSAADRYRITGACVSTVLLAGIVYPLFGRVVSVTDVARWSTFPIIPNFVDAGGSGFINAVGGLTALSIVWLVGPRLGKYPPKGMPAAIPAHNQVFVLFGCMLAWVGWLGLNGAGAILYTGMQPERLVLVIINTTLTAVAAALTAAVVTRVRFRRPDASLIANGWMAGLVASSA